MGSLFFALRALSNVGTLIDTLLGYLHLFFGCYISRRIDEGE